MPTLLDLNVRGHVREGFAPFVCGEAPELGSGRPQDAPTLIPSGADQWMLRVRLSDDFDSATAVRRLRTGVRSLAQEDFRLGAQLLPGAIRTEPRGAREDPDSPPSHSALLQPLALGAAAGAPPGWRDRATHGERRQCARTRRGVLGGGDPRRVLRPATGGSLWKDPARCVTSPRARRRVRDTGHAEPRST